MAAAGVGVDMLEIARMQRALERRPRLAGRVFTDEERAWCERAQRPAQRYAVLWAAREAVVKALGTGFGQGVGLRDVSVAPDDPGRPVVRLSGRAAELASERGVREVVLSLSHTHEMASACAVAVTDAARPAPSAREDAERALRASFREARSILDDLERVQDQTTEEPGS